MVPPFLKRKYAPGPAGLASEAPAVEDAIGFVETVLFELEESQATTNSSPKENPKYFETRFMFALLGQSAARILGISYLVSRCVHLEAFAGIGFGWCSEDPGEVQMKP